MSTAPLQLPQLLHAGNVSFAYGDRPVLRDVSLELASGEIVVLLGPNGSGKSTLIRVLLNHLRATGTIEWMGRPAVAWRLREMARAIAYLPQSPMYDASQRVGDVLRLGRAPYWSGFGIESEQDIAVVRAVAQRLNLTELLDRPMDEISGGQRQMVFVGRALVQEPRALLLDEPSTFLDLRHQVELCRLLRDLSREKQIGVLMASHDLNLATSFADRLVLLHEGRIAASGPPTDVLDPQVLSRVYEVTIDRIDRGPNNPPAVFPVVT